MGKLELHTFISVLDSQRVDCLAFIMEWRKILNIIYNRNSQNKVTAGLAWKNWSEPEMDPS